MSPARVSRRLVLFFPGFEAMPVEAHCRRFIREARKSAPVHGFFLPDDIPLRVEDDTGSFEMTATGEGWKTVTRIVVYGLGNAPARYASRNPAARIAGGIFGLADFVLTGTVLRFAATSWRYVLFFAYPLVLAGLVPLGAWLAFALAAAAGAGWAAAAVLAAGAGAAFLWFAARRLHFLLLMDDWTFARALARGRDADNEDAVAAAAADCKRRLAAFPEGEVVVAAHSLGAVAAIRCLAALLRQGEGRRIGLLTVGSSLLKVALHPAARELRGEVAQVAASGCDWLDVQALTDPINFYKSDPARALGIAGAAGVRTMKIRFRNQLSPASYRAMRRDFFRIHRQFVAGVERASDYSFHAILCGPQSFAHVARRPGLERDAYGGRA